MMKKQVLLLFMMLISTTLLSAEEFVSKVDVLKGERWWGVFVIGGPAMPFDEPFPTVDLAAGTEEQTTPFLISSRGRYIWSKEPFSISFDGDAFTITSPLEQVKAVTEGRNLREAYLICCHKYFPPDGKTPALELFTRPVYYAGSVLGFEPDGVALRDYADRVLQAGYPAGTLVLPAGWQSGVGTFVPDQERYDGDFSALVSDLHAKGFKVMLTVTPYVSSDGAMFRAHRHDAIFVTDAAGSPVVVPWEGGYSALYDLTRDPAASLIRQRLDDVLSRYGVDGYLFDCREARDVIAQAQGGAQRYLESWSALGNGYDFCQYTMSRSPGFDPRIHILDLDMPVGWDYLRAACAQIISANLLGYPYVSIDVDPQRLGEQPENNHELFLRGIQLSNFFPVMQVKFAPWLIRDQELSKALTETANRRVQMAEYYETLIRESARTAEPLLRHMEYEFPRNGFIDCNDQFMLGSRYMVAPLLSEGNSRTVRFPRGTWTDLDGKTYRGPVVTAVTSRNGLPLIFQKTR